MNEHTVRPSATRSPRAVQTSPLNLFLADPSLIIANNRFYLYPTTDGFEGWGSSTFQVFSSSDLVEWLPEGEILRLGHDVSWATERAWAPAALQSGGRFYLYFSADDNIGVAMADRPEGPFVDLGHPLVADGQFDGRAIDPSTFVDVDGTTWLLWGNTVAHAVPLSDDLVSFDPDAVRSWTPTAFREAITLHRRGDIYYITWSENDTREENYRVRWASGPSPLGPWVDGGVLLSKDPERGILATGHHDILQLPGDDQWLIAYHRFSIPGGSGITREIIFDRLEHGPNGELVPIVPAAGPFRVQLGDSSAPSAVSTPPAASTT